jgi:hypothetical protein
LKRNALIIWGILLLGLISVKAQTPPLLDQDDIQSWNDVQLTVPMTKQFDFVTQITGRFGKNVTRVNDGRFQIGFVYKPNKSWTLQPFLWFIRARNARGQFRTENRLNLRVGYKFPTKGFGLSHRSWFEYRIRNTGNTWRYRPSLTFEKDLPKKFNAKIYLTEEPFYDSALNKFSRNRFTVGINKTLTKNLSVDLYFMRQNDGNSRPGDLSVIGTTWKVRL